MIPVNTDTLVNSTAVKISMRSENNFWILLMKLASTLVLKNESNKRMQFNIPKILKIKITKLAAGEQTSYDKISSSKKQRRPTMNGKKIYYMLTSKKKEASK